jgi:hypothetical protein
MGDRIHQFELTVKLAASQLEALKRAASVWAPSLRTDDDPHNHVAQHCGVTRCPSAPRPGRRSPDTLGTAFEITSVRSDNGSLVVRKQGGPFHAIGDPERGLGADIGRRHLTDLADGDQVVARPAAGGGFHVIPAEYFR